MGCGKWLVDATHRLADATQRLSKKRKYMICPICKTFTHVLESRMRKDNTRRRSLECDNLHRFTTIESISLAKNTEETKEVKNKNIFSAISSIFSVKH